MTRPVGPEALGAEAFVVRMREEGARRYHDRHPFHLRMHEGSLRRDELQAWVTNRYYYQTRIPIKDALILAKSEDPAFRRMWIHRLRDHDGERAGEGGLEQWLRLAEAAGLDRDEVASCRLVLPGVAGPSADIERAADGAGALFFDGTFWSSDELVAAELGTRRAEDMAHWPVGGSGGSLELLAKLPGRRILIHVNNTNPMLREDGPEHAAVHAAGVEVAHDGLELRL